MWSDKRNVDEVGGDVDNTWLLACSVGYIKGQARVITLLCMARIMWEKNIHVKEVDWELWQSMRVIWVKYPYHANIQSEFFSNVKISNCGSIRKSANCITWVWGLQAIIAGGTLHGK